MANELSRDDGLSVTWNFIAPNLAAAGAATIDMTLPQLGTGYVVPTGYKFHPLMLAITFIGTLDAGATVIGKVIDNGTELAHGPVAQVDQADTETHATGVARVGGQPIAAGHVVGVSLTVDADYDTTGTIDWDAALTGILLPA